MASQICKENWATLHGFKNNQRENLVSKNQSTVVLITQFV